MNSNPNQTVTFSFTGQATVSRKVLIELLRDSVAAPSLPLKIETKSVTIPESVGQKLPRLAFGMRETCEMLGVSRCMLWGLIQRGLL